MPTYPLTQNFDQTCFCQAYLFSTLFLLLEHFLLFATCHLNLCLVSKALPHSPQTYFFKPKWIKSTWSLRVEACQNFLEQCWQMCWWIVGFFLGALEGPWTVASLDISQRRFQSVNWNVGSQRDHFLFIFTIDSILLLSSSVLNDKSLETRRCLETELCDWKVSKQKFTVASYSNESLSFKCEWPI